MAAAISMVRIRTKGLMSRTKMMSALRLMKWLALLMGELWPVRGEDSRVKRMKNERRGGDDVEEVWLSVVDKLLVLVGPRFRNTAVLRRRPGELNCR